MPLRIPAVTAGDVWAYIARTLTDPASYKADVSGLETEADAATRATAFLLAIAGTAPAGEYDTEMGRITAARGILIDALGTPADFMANITTLLTTAHFNLSEFEKCQAPATENAAVPVSVTTADQSLGAKDITVDIPAGATIISVIALARVGIMNNAATAQKIDLKFEVESVVLFNQTDIVGFGAVDGASAVYVIAENATDEVTADAQVVTLEAKATLSAAASVRFQVQYYLFITYKMG